MMSMKNRVFNTLIVLSAIVLVLFLCCGIASSANDRKIIIDKNLKPGMILKEAIELLGPPESIKLSNAGTIIIPYDTLGLSIEVVSDGKTIDSIHIESSFKGSFASGLEIGAETQKIISVYNQPDIFTGEKMEYSSIGRIFQIHQGKVTGADLYSDDSKLYHRIAMKEPEQPAETRATVRTEISKEVREELRKELREEVREEVKEEVRKEVKEKVREEIDKEYNQVYNEDTNIFDLYGFKVKQVSQKVIIKEITPGSLAEKGGLKVGEPIRKAFYQSNKIQNIYAIKGLEAILRRAVVKRQKTINILQEGNRYYIVNVPGVK